MDKGREKSRTPKDDRKKQEEKVQKDTKAAAKKSTREEKEAERKRLEFPVDDTQSKEADANIVAEEAQQAVAVPKRARFSESEEESSEPPKSTASDKSKITQASKSETPSMALTTKRLEDMTVSTPVRGDGTKTPLKMPPSQSQKHRKSSSQSRSSTSDEENHTDTEEERMETEEDITVENIQKEMRKIRKRQREEQDATNKRLHEMQQQVQDNTYDIESHARINAHLLQKKLQEDARNASLSLTIEGFPKDASEQDRTAFANWVLQQANSKDRDAHTSLMNTRGELSNIIVLKFSSGFHRNQIFQWYIENFTHRRQKLWWWATSTARETNNEIRVRKTLSEDARMRGRFLKAAMEAINESQTNDNFEFYPSWNENAVSTKYSHGYLIWLHFSYATASCDIFADEQVFDDVQAHFESKLEAISINAGRGKGKGKSKDKGGEERKGTSKGVYAAMDYAFDPKIPFWCKFACVHDWRNNVQVQQALKDEDKAQARMDTFEG